MFIFVLFSVYLELSKYGDIKLGQDDSKPDFSTASWFTMLFGAGMEIGLVIWGAAEPLNHFTSPINNRTFRRGHGAAIHRIQLKAPPRWLLCLKC